MIQNVDPYEARLEAAEINKYLLAKTFFDCREYDRCAAVFLPDSLMSGVLPFTQGGQADLFGEEIYTTGGDKRRESGQRQATGARNSSASLGGSFPAKTALPSHGPVATDAYRDTGKSPLETDHSRTLPEISQKSLFLALYAKMISGEKRKDEEVEMVLGPHDTGDVVNRQLRIISAYLQTWFDQNMDEDDERVVSQGWLEYL